MRCSILSALLAGAVRAQRAHSTARTGTRTA
jgi:hypothetical protein